MLIDLEEAFVANLLAFLISSNPAYKEGPRIHLSLSDDRDTHFKEMEEVRKLEDLLIKVPFAIVHRFEHKSRIRSGASSQSRGQVTLNTPSSPDGDARAASFRQFSIGYKLIIYSNTYKEVTNLFEYWLLNAGLSHTSFQFTVPDSDDSVLEASMTFEEPVIVAPDHDEYASFGLVYRQDFDITLHSVVIGIPDDEHAILTPISNVFVLNPNEEFPT